MKTIFNQTSAWDLDQSISSYYNSNEVEKNKFLNKCFTLNDKLDIFFLTERNQEGVNHEALYCIP